MFTKINHIIVGLTTFNTRFLRISVPALGRLQKDIYLIIHNDNPNVTVTKSQIRKLGYRGRLCIINAAKNGGPLKARLNILSAIEKLGIKSEWMLFVDDDDILINIDTPDVQENNFAVMQNMIFIRRRLHDLLRVMDDPNDYVVDDFNVTVEKPHIGIVGTLLRTNLMVSLGKMMTDIFDQIKEIDNSLDTREPEDIVMWFYLQMYAKHLDPAAAAIYMDHANYIAVNLDTSDKKYDKKLIPDDQSQEYYDDTMSRYLTLFEELLIAKK